MDKSRSQKNGTWIARIAQLSEELVKHANLLNKINGKIEFTSKQSGFIKVEGDDKSFWFSFQDVVSNDQERPLIPGRIVRFCPADFNGEPIAVALEAL